MGNNLNRSPFNLIAGMKRSKLPTQLRLTLEKLNFRNPKRIPTKKPQSAKEKILREKKSHSFKKKLRWDFVWLQQPAGRTIRGNGFYSGFFGEKKSDF